MDIDKGQNQIAPPGAVFVCVACGKRSRDLYGNQRLDYGWDVSCVLNSMLCVEETLVMNGGRVSSADPWEEETETASQPGDDVTKPPLPPQWG